MPSRVQVVAPKDLPGGYELECEVGGQITFIKVPPEGVKKGETFIGTIVDIPTASAESSPEDNDVDIPFAPQENNAVGIPTHPPTANEVMIDELKHRVPKGRWRDECLECFNFGFCHPMFCLAVWCGPCVLGQVMTRMKLDGCGERIAPTMPATFCSTFKTLFTLTAIVWTISIPLCIFLICALAYIDKYSGGYYSGYSSSYYGGYYTYYYNDPFLQWCYYNSPYFLLILVPMGIAWWVYFLVIMRRTRKFVRERYNIPGDCCGDCCLSCCCVCCSTSQMARHTVDYRQHSAACCTDTGLHSDIEEVKVSSLEMPRQ